MKIFVRTIFLLSIVMALSVSTLVRGAMEEPIAIDEGFSLSTELISRLKVGAAKGDSEAALKLSLHYSSGVNVSKSDARFWRQIAAENGNVVAQYTIWFFDHESEDEFVKERALFWLRKAAEAGYDRARKELSAYD